MSKGEYTAIGEWTHHIDMSCGYCGSDKVNLKRPSITIGLITWDVKCQSCNNVFEIKFIVDTESIDIRPYKMNLLLENK